MRSSPVTHLPSRICFIESMSSRRKLAPAAASATCREPSAGDHRRVSLSERDRYVAY
jgi:hypothetical protein